MRSYPKLTFVHFLPYFKEGVGEGGGGLLVVYRKKIPGIIAILNVPIVQNNAFPTSRLLKMLIPESANLFPGKTSVSEIPEVFFREKAQISEIPEPLSALFVTCKKYLTRMAV